MKRILLSIILGLVVLLPVYGYADDATPLQLSLWNPVQLVPEDRDVSGLRLNFLYGKNQGMNGLDIGVANSTTRHVKGLQLGAVSNSVESDASGLQMGGFLNDVGKDVKGVQVAGIANGADNVKGAQIGVAGNYANGDVQGVQVGLVNAGNETVKGLQLGLWNTVDEDASGLQIALVNVSETMSGGQIGLINIIKKGRLRFFPIINLGFAGSEI